MAIGVYGRQNNAQFKCSEFFSISGSPGNGLKRGWCDLPGCENIGPSPTAEGADAVVVGMLRTIDCHADIRMDGPGIRRFIRL